MDDLLTAVTEEFLLHSVLLAVGFAGVVTGMYRYFKRHSIENVQPETISAPVCEQAMEPALVQSLEVLQDQDQVTDAVNEEEEEILWLVVANAQLETKVSRLEELLHEALKEKEMMSNMCEREQEALCKLLTQYNEMKNAHIYEEDVLKASLMEAEQKHQNALQTIAQLEAEKSHLQSECNERIVTVTDGEEEVLKVSLMEAEQKHENALQTIAQLEAEKSHLQSEYSKWIITLTDREEALKVSLAEAKEKYKVALDTISQLEAHKYDLTQQVETLQEKVQDTGYKLSKGDCDDQLHECEQEHKAHRIVQAEYEDITTTAVTKDEILKAVLSQMRNKIKISDEFLMKHGIPLKKNQR